MSLVRVIPLGGVGEIGKNCTVVEQGDDLIVIDCGLSFPNEEMLGVDIVVPDFTYLVQNHHRLRGVFITHAHEDHVGGLPYLLSQLKVPVYCTEFTQALIRQKLEERLPKDRIDIRVFRPGDRMPIGGLEVESIRVTHSIPETCAMAIHTVHGVLLFTADFKFDFTPVDAKPSNITRLGELARDGVLCLFSDSTNVDRPGWGPSERSVTAGLRSVFAAAPGRVLLTAFSSNIHRMQQVYDVAAEFGRKVAVIGRRMEQNVDISERLGYMRIPKSTRIRLDEMNQYPDEKIAILTTGSQGEPLSALVQMSKGEYGRMRVKAGDTLIYSARPIPGNEAAIWRTVNRLFDQGVNVIYESETPIHVSGHGYREELKMMINLTRPFYVAPVHGEARHQYAYKQIALGMGYPDHRVFTMQDCVPLEFRETSAEMGERVAGGRVLIDQSTNTGVSDDVLRDRYNIANDGIVIVTVPIDITKGALAGEPLISAKAFSGDDRVLDQAKDALYDVLNALSPAELKEAMGVKQATAETVKRVIQKRANLRPLILPVVVEL